LIRAARVAARATGPNSLTRWIQEAGLPRRSGDWRGAEGTKWSLRVDMFVPGKRGSYGARPVSKYHVEDQIRALRFVTDERVSCW